jgi:hypothetical protein
VRLQQEVRERREEVELDRLDQLDQKARKQVERLEEWFKKVDLDVQNLERLEGGKEHSEQDSRNKKPVWLNVAVAFICVGGFLVPYILARLFLLVEVFRTLCFLPPDVFVDTWSGSFPHIG